MWRAGCISQDTYLLYGYNHCSVLLYCFIILFHYGFSEFERFESVTFILPRLYPAVLTIFAGQGRAARVFHGVGRGTPPGHPSLVHILNFSVGEMGSPHFPCSILIFNQCTESLKAMEQLHLFLMVEGCLVHNNILNRIKVPKRRLK